jgi:hypothetical protein
VVKARNVRDKRTTKSNSFRSLSFANTDDYFHIANDMDGEILAVTMFLSKKKTPKHIV